MRWDGRMRICLFLIGLTAIVLACRWLAESASAPPSAPRTAPWLEDPRTARRAESGPGPSVPLRKPAPPVAGHYRLTVLNSVNEPVPATLYHAKIECDYSYGVSGHRADADGVILVEEEEVTQLPPDETFYLWHSDYIVRSVVFDQPSQVVILQTGHSLRIECHDADTGSPVPNATVLAISGHGDARHLRALACRFNEQQPHSNETDVSIVPGPSPHATVRAARSDASGCAIVRGLPTGAYRMSATHSSLSLVAADAALDNVLVPGPTLTMEWAQPYAVVLTFEPKARCLTWGAVHHAKHYRRSTTAMLHGYSEVALRAKFPGADCIVARVPSRAMMQDSEGLFLEMRLLVDGVGWWRHRARMRPVGEIRQAEVLSLPEGAEETAATFKWTIGKGLARIQERDRPQLRLVSEHGGYVVEFRVTEGTATRLPLAHYRLQADNPFLQSALALPETIVLASDQTLELSLNVGLQPLRLSATSPTGRSVGLLSVRIAQPMTGQEFHVTGWDPSAAPEYQPWRRPSVWWLPPGEYEVRLEARGYLPVVSHREVIQVPTDDWSIETMRFDLTPR